MCPAVRSHDNVRKESQVVMKFSTKFSLIYVSVEFEDEPDWRNSFRDIAKILIFPYDLLYENRPISAFIKNFFYHSQNKTPTIIYNSIENFTNYKMVYKALKI